MILAMLGSLPKYLSDISTGPVGLAQVLAQAAKERTRCDDRFGRAAVTNEDVMVAGIFFMRALQTMQRRCRHTGSAHHVESIELQK
jgi:hypothetical protein